MRHLATYFDSHYLPRALALFASLDRHEGPWTAHILALNDEAAEALKAQGRDNLRVTRLADFEAAHPELAAAKAERSRIEYYFTMGPAYILSVLEAAQAPEAVTYVDADLYFFGSPQPLYDELAGASVGLVPHGFSPRNQASLEAGRFNVGWIYFKNDASGLACLRWWKDRCIEWCFDRVEADRYADQKYLDGFPELFEGVKIVSQRGANAAPWNVDGMRFSEKAGQLRVDESPLLFYHFHGLKQLRPWLFDLNIGAYGARCWGLLRRRVYLPYLAELEGLQAGLSLGGIRRAPSRPGLLGRLRMAKRAIFNGSYAFKFGKRFF